MQRLKGRLLRCWHWISRLLDKIPAGQNRSLFFNHMNGKFRVRYPEGGLTQLVCYDVAKSYASIYGGEIFWEEERIRAEGK